MPLPTRASFLETGLVPVPNTTDTCPICLTEPMASPVQIPCKHTFCDACITKWLTESNSCAMCRAQLFAKQPARNPLLTPDPVRQLHALHALEASGLANLGNTVGAAFENAAPTSAIDMFEGYFYDGPAVNVDVMQLMRSAARAYELVTWDRTPTPVGPVTFHATSLATNLIAMANMLRHMAAQQGRPYAPAGNPWGELVSVIWRAMAPKMDSPTDALIVPGTIMRALNHEFAYDVRSGLNVFSASDAAEADLAMLIGMVVDSAQQENRRDSAQQDLMAVARGGVPRGESSRAGGRMRDRLARRTEGRCVVM